MDAFTLLTELVARGRKLSIEGDRLMCEGAGYLPRSLAEQVRANRDDLIQLLRGAPLEPVATVSVTSDVASASAAPVHAETWVDIDGVKYSPGAAALLARSVPYTSGTETQRTCFGCRGTLHWRLRAGCPWVCATCHPSQLAPEQIEWSDAEARSHSFGLDPRGPTTAPALALHNDGEVRP